MKNLFELKDDVLVKYLGEKISEDAEEPSEVVIPEGIKVIGENAFKLANIKKVVLPSTLEVIEEGAFYLAFNLEHINFPESLKRIGPGAFTETGIKKVLLNGDGIILDGCFLDCHSLCDVKLCNNVYIKDGTFNYCSELEELYIPDYVQEIELDVFNNCNKLNVIVTKDIIKKYGKEVFNGVNSIILRDDNNKKYSYQELLNEKI